MYTNCIYDNNELKKKKVRKKEKRERRKEERKRKIERKKKEGRKEGRKKKKETHSSGVEIHSCCENRIGFLQIYWGRIFTRIFEFFYILIQCILRNLRESIWILAKSSGEECRGEWILVFSPICSLVQGALSAVLLLLLFFASF